MPKNLHMSPCEQHVAHALYGDDATCRSDGSKREHMTTKQLHCGTRGITHLGQHTTLTNEKLTTKQCKTSRIVTWQHVNIHATKI